MGLRVVCEERKARSEERLKKARRQLTAAHTLACYRCFLPDLADFTRLRCAGPAPDELQYSIIAAECAATALLPVRGVRDRA
jgi:hypothetical protein